MVESLEQWSDEIQILKANNVFAFNRRLLPTRRADFGLLDWCVFWLVRLVLFDGGKTDSPRRFLTKLLFDPMQLLCLPDQTHQSGSLIRRCLGKLARSLGLELPWWSRRQRLNRDHDWLVVRMKVKVTSYRRIANIVQKNTCRKEFY